MTTAFVHLHLHTEYSLVDGIVRVEDLVEAAAAAGMPACAVTDQSNLFAMVKFYRAAQAVGVKPIVGVELWVRDTQHRDDPARLVLLCQNRTGYLNLTRLVSRSYTEGQVRGVPGIDREWLAGCTEGLIALSGGREGEVGRALLAGQGERAEQVLREMLALFPDRYYLEVMRTGREGEEHYLHAAVTLAAKCDAPVVASNDVRFLRQDEFEAHEARVCIHDGRVLNDPRRPRHYSEQQYLRTPQEMAELFADLPEALENSVEIARRCNLELTLGKNVLPEFPVPKGMDVADYLRRQAEQGLDKRLPRILAGAADPEATRKLYQERLALELDVIVRMGFPGYFLIVADFIDWARHNGVPVGPGRGSGAGSLVAYALGITDLDPIQYDLLFERFLNPERVSMPDFDVDFCMEGRDRVIEYVAERYGRERVSQIITYGSMAAKAVVRDVGRVLGHPYGFCDRIAKLIPFELGMTLDKALEQEEELRRLYNEDDEVRTLIDLARALEGLARNAGKHAGGVVIAPSRLTDFTPLYCEQGSAATVTQFDKDDVEAVGLVKFDFLGLRTLTIIDWAVQTINHERVARDAAQLDISALPMDDAASFELLKRCATTAVFQLESRGMKDLIKRLQPDCFEDIVALVALFRPGPLQSGMVDDFIARKHGRQQVEYPHPDLEPILKPTYGVILYQEQVMQIAQVLAGYTLGGADLLRRAMGKKKPEEMAKQRAVFVDGAKARGVAEATATYIFDLMEKFAGYGFNKCVVGDTRLLHAETGEFTTVESLFMTRRPWCVHALGEDWRLHRRAVTDVVWNGRKRVYELKTALGKHITATGNHPFRTLQGWKHLGELKPGERIAVPRRLDIDSTCRWPHYRLIALAGLISEGNTCHPSSLYFFSNDRLMVDDFANAAARFPNSVARIHERVDGRLEVCVNTGRDARFRPGQVPWNARADVAVALDETALPARCGMYEWAEQLGITGKKADRKFVPGEVFSLCDSDIELFLGRLWSGDGFIANARLCTPFYATSSRQLAEDVQTLLLRLGLLSRIHEKSFKYRGGHRAGYTVHVFGPGSLEDFSRRIGPHLIGRSEQMSHLLRHLHDTQRGLTSKDTIPAEVRAWIAEERLRQGITWEQLEQQSGVCTREFTGSGSHVKQGFRRDTLARLATFFGSARLAAIANADVYWDRVVVIEDRGIQDTYDLTVDTDHNFVADGLIVHNSHSAAYALVSYQTAWLKAHDPAAFMAAVLSADMDNTDKVVTLIDECRDMKLTVTPPDINHSAYAFTVSGIAAIRYGLGAIKGVGLAAIEGITAERDANGAYRDLFDFCRRIDLRKANRRVLEALIRCGALDALGDNRASLMASLPAALHLAEQHLRDASAGQEDLFGLAAAPEENAMPDVSAHTAHLPEWDEAERLAGEKDTLGLYLTGHPIARYEQELAQFTSGRIADVTTAPGEDWTYSQTSYGKASKEQAVVLAGLVVGLRTLQTSRGGRMAFVTLDDRSARVEIAVFSETYQRYRNLLLKDKLLVVEGSLSPDEYTGGYRVSAVRVLDIDQAREVYAKRLIIDINTCQAGNGFVPALQAALTPFRAGPCPVLLDFHRHDAEGQIVLGAEWRVHPTDELLHRLRELAGSERVRVEY